MRLSSKTLSLMLNMLLGSAWALTAVGAFGALYRYGSVSWLYAIASALVWSLPGLVAVVVLEYLMRGFERHEHIRRQTHILEEMLREIKTPERK